jgi:glycolate oxidase iron-sulfur subunit
MFPVIHPVKDDAHEDRPQQADLDRCVHCGLCLQACPTYRELGLEADSPRGRIYQMIQVHEGAPVSDSYREHIDLCLACRACETACPSGVPYGRLVEAARADIESKTQRPWHIRALRSFVYNRLLPSPELLTIAGSALWLYQVTGLQKLVRFTGIARLFGMSGIEALAPPAEPPFFFSKFGKTFSANGDRKYRVALLGGCIGSISFARLNEATIRVLQGNGCEVVLPASQTCCGALHVHAGLREKARELARCNVDAFLSEPFDAILVNAAGCGCALKEYHELLEGDARAAQFSALVKDVNEFLAAIPLNKQMRALNCRVTYQDSCHLLHGQKIRNAPRQLIAQVPGVEFREMPHADYCCGSAGVYNVLHNDMAMQILADKMADINSITPDIIVTANTGCILQLRAGVRSTGKKTRVLHVIELLDEAYSKPT